MSATNPHGTPGIMSVAGLLASIESNMGGVPTSATAAAAAGLQGTHLLYDEDVVGSTPMKTEREGGLGTLGFPGGTPREFPWFFSLRRMLGDIAWGKLDGIECVCCRRYCVMWRSMRSRSWKF
jgi:hypothetical protein